MEVSQMHEKMTHLETCIKNQDIDQAKKTLNELLVQLFIVEKHSVDFLIKHALELINLISTAHSFVSGIIRKFSIYRQAVESVSCVKDLDKLYHWFNVMLHQLFDSITETQGHSYIIRTVIAYIQEYIHKNVQLSDVASLVYLSPSYLSKRFKKETGITFIHYVAMQKINLSIVLLNHPSYAIVDIANALSYYDQSHFTKMFKKYTGYAPFAFKFK
jgi:two-component system, response regulator YesN